MEGTRCVGCERKTDKVFCNTNRSSYVLDVKNNTKGLEFIKEQFRSESVELSSGNRIQVEE